MVGGRGRDRTGDPLLAKQVLSQLSYTPTVGVTFILEHFRGIQNPFLRFCVITVPKPLGKGLFAPQAMDFFVRVVNETCLLLLDESVAPTKLRLRQRWQPHANLSRLWPRTPPCG